jgi:hypothetical protein
MKYYFISLLYKAKITSDYRLHLSTDWEVAGWKDSNGAAIGGGEGSINDNGDVVGAIAVITSVASRLNGGTSGVDANAEGSVASRIDRRHWSDHLNFTEESSGGSNVGANGRLDGLAHVTDEGTCSWHGVSGGKLHVSRWVVADVVAWTRNKYVVARIGGCLVKSAGLAALS